MVDSYNPDSVKSRRDADGAALHSDGSDFTERSFSPCQKKTEGDEEGGKNKV